jgi:hypothetical protein
MFIYFLTVFSSVFSCTADRVDYCFFASIFFLLIINSAFGFTADRDKSCPYRIGL